MTMRGFVFWGGIFLTLMGRAGASGLPCVDLTSTLSKIDNSSICLYASLENGYCTFDGSYTCNEYKVDTTTFGCQRNLRRPLITHEPAGTLRSYASGGFITLVCNADTDGVTGYAWFRLNVEVTSQNEKRLIVSDTSNRSVVEVSYGCQYMVEERISPMSYPYRTAIYSNTDPFHFGSLQLALRGVPLQYALDGMLLQLRCERYHEDSLTTEWYWDGSLFATTPNNMYNDFQINSTTAGGFLRCNVIYNNINLATDHRPIMVFIPAITNSLPDLTFHLETQHFNTGDSVELSCTFSEEDFTERSLSGLPVTFEWYINGTTVTEYTTMNIEVAPLDPAVHHGEWSCSASYDGNPQINSPINFLYVGGTLEVQVTTLPEVPVMGAALFLFCRFTYSFEYEDNNIRFQWTFDGAILRGYTTDDYLYLSTLTEDLSGEYTCTVDIQNRVNATSSITLIDPVSPPDFPKPSMRVVGLDDPQNLTFGAHELTCTYNTSYAVHGQTITFFKDGNIMDNSIVRGTVEAGTEEVACMDAFIFSGQLNAHLDNDIYDHSYTCRVEFEGLSSEESDALTVSFVVFDSLRTLDESGRELTSLNLIANDEVFLRCSAVLVPGVPGEVRYSWYIVENGELYPNTDAINITARIGTMRYVCEAQLGSHAETSMVTIVAYELVSPNLMMVDRPPADHLTFSETYEISCDTDTLMDNFDIEFEFSEDEVVVYTGNLSTYTISNDIITKSYTCRAAVGTVRSPLSNSFAVQFRTIDGVEIQTSDGEKAPSVITATNNSPVKLICNFNRSPDVPEDTNATYNWYDLHFTSHGNLSELEVETGVSATFRCSAKLGDFLQISTNNITIMTSASVCNHITLFLVFTIVVAGLVLVAV